MKLQQEIKGLVERNHELKENLQSQRERITELEKENLVHSKENHILQSELDYENLRASQLQQHKINSK